MADYLKTVHFVTQIPFNRPLVVDVIILQTVPMDWDVAKSVIPQRHSKLLDPAHAAGSAVELEVRDEEG
jgi:hypothetical protein